MKTKIKILLKNFIFIFIGSIISAAGLEFFIVPNQMIDGGIVGISIMTSYITHVPLSLFLIILNIPFMFLGYKKIGKSFTISSLFSIMCFSYWVSVFHPIPSLTKDLFLAAIFGGIILGIGVGIIIKYGGSLDGTEVVAIILDKKTGFSVGEIVMFFNLFILSLSGLVYSWDRAMYSLIAYFIAYKSIDVIIQGLNEIKGVMIVSNKPDEISQMLIQEFERGVTLLFGEGGYLKESKKIIYSTITRLEISKLKTMVNDIDESAFITINDIHDILGGHINKKQKKLK